MSSAKTVLSFLVKAKNAFKVLDSTSDFRVKIVTGNQSGDLDSVVSSIAYAYYESLYDPSSRIIPMLNMNKGDLKLRKDIVFVLSNRGITAEHLFFIEDLKTLRNSINTNLIDLILVDHNSPQGAFSDIENNVVGIIDHHEDENLFGNADPRIIVKCGSCSSLVFNYWYARLHQNNELFSPDIQLIASPLLIDTASMKNKVEAPDVEAFKVYQDLSSGFGFQYYFKEISDKKKDFTGLSFRDIMRKDYKQYNIETKSMGSKKVGISSIVKHFDWLLKLDGINFASDISSYGDENRLDLVILLTSGVDSTGEFKREIAFLNRDPSDNLDSLVIARVSEELELKLTETHGVVKIFRQFATKCTRKQIAPAVKHALESI